MSTTILTGALPAAGLERVIDQVHAVDMDAIRAQLAQQNELA